MTDQINRKRSWLRQALGAGALLTAGGAVGVFGLGSYHPIVAKAPSTALTETQLQAVEQASNLSLAFRSASDRVLPAVVSIHNTVEGMKVSRRGNDNADNNPDLNEMDPLLRKFFGDVPGYGGNRGMSPFGDRQRARESSGSGVIIDAAGIILTNTHVVEGGGKISVRLHDGRQFDAVEVKTDPNTDIAVIKIKANTALPFATLGDSDTLQVGDWVLALGQPFGLQDTVTAGIISAKGREVNITRHAEFLQTDAAINPGNSGGPLVNLRGEIVGINTAISSSSGGFQGIGFAVPVNVAKWVSTQLAKDGKVHRAFIGVGIQSVTPEIAEQLGLSVPAGALVTDVVPDSPAAVAGLKPQDVIVEFAGRDIHSHGQLHATASRSEIGSEQSITVIRDGKPVTMNLKLKELPANLAGDKNSSEVPKGYGDEPSSQQKEDDVVSQTGLSVSTVEDTDAKRLNLKNNHGVLISTVAPHSAASASGLEPDMVILQVGKRTVSSPEEFALALKDANLEKGILLLVRTEQGARYLVLKDK